MNPFEQTLTEETNTDLTSINDEVEKSLETNVEVQVKKDVLQKVIRRLDRAREKRGVLPIKQGIYLYFGEDQLIGRAMNGDYSIEVVHPRVEDKKENYTFLSGERGGAIFMDQKFPSMVNSLPRKNIKITINGGESTISAGRSSFEVKVLDEMDFPNFLNKREGSHIKIHADVLKRMYSKTSYATSKQETRPSLTGVLHKLEENKFSLISTDAHRLAQVHFDLEEEVKDISQIIPSIVLDEVNKQLDDTVVNVDLYINDRAALYALDNGTTIFSRVIDQRFPDTNRLIPEDFTTEIHIHAVELKELLNRAILVDDSNSPIQVLIKAKDRQARIISREADKAGFTEDIGLIKGEGDDIKLGVNAKYLLDTLNQYGPATVLRFNFTTNMRPFLIRLANGDEDNLDLILPVRLAIDMSGPVVIDNFRADYQVEMLEEEKEEVK